DAAGRGQERGRAEHEHTFEHGACLGEMVALAQSVSHLSCVSIWTAYRAPQGRTSTQRKRNVGVAFKGTRWYDMQHNCCLSKYGFQPGCGGINPWQSTPKRPTTRR